MTYRFDLVAEQGQFEFSERGWEKARFHLSELQPATRVSLIGDTPSRIRVVAIGDRADVAPALLIRVEELVGTPLRVEMFS